MVPDRSWVDSKTFLLCEVGSTLHGISAADNDLDQMGVCIEPIDAAFPIHGVFEQHIYRTAAIREGRQDAPSQPGDIDRTVYSLRKWVRLALDGNPSVILLMFAPWSALAKCDANGTSLRAYAPYFASRRAGARFLGYLQQQRQRLLGERGQKGVTRAALVEKFGYDCYADDTEFLTRHGWKLYDEIAHGEAVATVNQESRQVEFQVPVERVAKQYSGSIFTIKHRYTQCRVTANHRMWTSKVQRGPCGRDGAAYRANQADWTFLRADELAGYLHVQVASEPRQSEYAIGDDLLKIVGAYVSEGSIAKRLKSGRASVVSFAQQAGGRLEPVMSDIGATHALRRYEHKRADRKDVSVTWTLADRTIAAMLADDCGTSSSTKRLPSWAFDLSSRQAEVLLDALIAGDGTTYKRTGYRVYCTQSRRLAGDVQALAVLSGRRSNTWGPYAPAGMYQVLVMDDRHGRYQAIRGDTNITTVAVESTRVVCFTVQNETLVTRRNGRVAMHGNTKYASHIIRLGYQGVEYLETGRLTLPLSEPKRQRCIDIRAGKVDMNEMMTEAGELEQRVKDLCDTSPLPAEPDTAFIQEWMLGLYLQNWKADDVQNDIAKARRIKDLYRK